MKFNTQTQRARHPRRFLVLMSGVVLALFGLLIVLSFSWLPGVVRYAGYAGAYLLALALESWYVKTTWPTYSLAYGSMVLLSSLLVVLGVVLTPFGIGTILWFILFWMALGWIIALIRDHRLFFSRSSTPR